jgi:diguanylate cyclase (GGDEF)-like protein/PAS domain S-box-containing protein
MLTAFKAADSWLGVDDRETEGAKILVGGEPCAWEGILSRDAAPQGWDVAYVASTQQLIDRLIDEEFDLLILDFACQCCRGLDVLRQVREMYSAVDLPVLAVVDEGDSQAVVGAFAGGASDCVARPLDGQATQSRIARHVELKKAQSSLRESQQRFAMIARAAHDGLWDWNLRTGIISCSPRWRQMLGYAEGAVDSTPEGWFSLLHPEDRARVEETFSDDGRSCRLTYDIEFRMRHADGHYRWMLCRGVSVRDHRGRPVRIAGSLTDVTESKVSDSLTGLGNELSFKDRLEERIRRFARPGSLPFAVLSLGVDNFKLVNESLGREAGDQLLGEIATRLKQYVRLGDAVSQNGAGGGEIARQSGDVFTVLLGAIRRPKDAELVAERILGALAQPFHVGRQVVFSTASIGIAVVEDGNRTAEEILRAAETAMHYAKSQGRSQYRVFDAAMHEKAATRIVLDHDLRRAVAENELIVHYQPIISLESRRAIGVEALVRWNHPTRGFVSPGDFIPLAEETGLIVPIGKFVMSEACRQAAAWQWRHPGDPPLIVSVNISLRQLADEGLVDFVREVVRETGVDPRGLKLEVTESTLMENPERVTRILNELREMKVQIGLDDFGTGYSCLSILRRLPLDVLKVDRSFVSDMTERDDSAAIVKTILALAHSLKLEVIAEGVETAEQAELLAKLGCRKVQGYYFSPPVSAEKITQLLAEQNVAQN